MSLYELTVPGLAITPKLSIKPGNLEARTGSMIRWLSLLAYERYLTVDRATRLIILEVRRWWFLSRCTVLHFHQIEYICYDFGKVPLDFAYNARGADSITEFDWFNIGLKVRGETRPMWLFRYQGEGGVLSSGIGLALGVEQLLTVLGITGDEEPQSLKMIRALEELLEVPVSSPFLNHIQGAIEKISVPCPRCGRSISSGCTRCLYCGSRFSQPLQAPDT